MKIRDLLESKDNMKTLYIHRNVKNYDDLKQWAIDNKLPSFVKPNELHVTIIYSKAKLDWDTIPKSASQLTLDVTTSLDQFGDATVLKFTSKDLQNRWRELIDLGAKYDYDEYKPHITITYLGKDLDLSKITPYKGKLELGPEIFEELDNSVDSKEERANREIEL